MSHPEDQLLDRAVAAARQEGDIPDAQLDGAVARLRASLHLPESAGVVPAVLGCTEIQVLMQQRLTGTLEPAQATLVADHVKDCFACRRAERELREAPLRRVQPEVAASSWRWSRMAAAAAMVGALATGAWFARQALLPTTELEVIAGRLILPSSGEVVGAGATINATATVRTPAGEGAIIRLADGSRVELDQRSSLAVRERSRATVLELDRGRLLVEAAKQHGGHRLQVQTRDSLVTVVGTVFSVNAGMLGSRVGVLEGSVRVGTSGEESLLGPGQQVTSNDRLAKVDLADEVSWAQDPERYLALLRELGALDTELAALPREGLRTVPSLEASIPAATATYVALPNVSARLADSWAIASDRLSSNPAVSQWWQALEAEGTIAEIDRAVTLLADLGQALGEEVVVIRTGDAVAALAPVLDPASLRSTLMSAPELAEIGQELTIVDGAELPAGDGPTVWFAGDLVAVGDRAVLREVAATRAGAPSWSGGAVHAAAMARYQTGVELLVVSLGDFTEVEAAPMFVLEDRVVGTRHETRLALEAGAGSALPEPLQWIAAPAAIGALELISADAVAAATFAIEDPRAAAEALVRIGGEHDSELAAHLADLRDNHGIDALEDIAAPLGGEMALAIDGPVVPKPAWKLILEVDDPSRLDMALERMVVELNQVLTQEGGTATVATVNSQGLDTHVVEITTPEGATSSFVWAYLDTYLVVAPDAEAIARAARNRDSGYTLGRSTRLQQALPIGGENGVSGLVWLDLNGAAGAFDLLAASLPADVRQEAAELLSNGEPLVGVLLATPDRLELAGSRAHSPLGWLRLVMLAGVLGGNRTGDPS
jgi:hypothetical protein